MYPSVDNVSEDEKVASPPKKRKRGKRKLEADANKPKRKVGRPSKKPVGPVELRSSIMRFCTPIPKLKAVDTAADE